MTLPSLTGTEAQIRWAESLRGAMLHAAAQDPNFSRELVAHMVSIKDAAWWIANKDRTPAQIRFTGAGTLPEERLSLPCWIRGKEYTIEFSPLALAKLAKALGRAQVQAKSVPSPRYQRRPWEEH